LVHFCLLKSKTVNLFTLARLGYYSGDEP